MTEEERQKQQDRIYRLIALNERLNAIQIEFSQLHNEFHKENGQEPFLENTQKTIDQLQTEIIEEVLDADQKLNSC